MRIVPAHCRYFQIIFKSLFTTFFMCSLGQLQGLKPHIVLTYIDIDDYSRAHSGRVLVTESLIYNVGKYNKCAVPIVRRTGCASYTDL
jgi:hypothetical protein